MKENKVTEVTRCIKMTKKTIEKRLPEILTGLGIAGMLTSTVIAVKSTPKALKLIDAEKEKRKSEGNNEDLKPVDIVQIAWKPYLPVLALSASSVACLIGANSVHGRRHAALYSAYKLSETALSDFKSKVEEVVPEKKVKEIKQKIAEDKVDDAVNKENKADGSTKVIISSDGDTWFVDPFTNGSFLSSTTKIDAAINRLNKRLFNEMFVSLSDLYDELELEHTTNSDYVGWSIDDDLIESDFSDAIVRNGKAYVVMDFTRRPEYGYDDKQRLHG